MDSEAAFQQPATPEERDGSQLAMVSSAMVRLYKEQFGRGPTKSYTRYAGPDILITTLEETMTAAERNLVALGEHKRLRDIRTLFQYAAERQFVETVERITGRKVRGLVSGNHAEEDLSTEVFYLEPLER